MEHLLAQRITKTQRSFIRDILKLSQEPNMISFAGGIPNPMFFPVMDLQAAMNRVIERDGAKAFQYATTEGFDPLRAVIAKQYLIHEGVVVDPEQILITNGSQQALDLIGKVLINEGDQVMMEEPGYLGAIQALSLYQPQYIPLPLTNEGPDAEVLGGLLAQHQPKIIYTVPNFQNPSGLSYNEESRLAMAKLVQAHRLLLVEDDPYGDLRFAGQKKSSFLKLCPDNTLRLGSFSKTLVPGFRIGWVVIPKALYGKFVTAKQAADLHTSTFNQMVVHEYLTSYDADAHVQQVAEFYGQQCRVMEEAMAEHFPAGVETSHPEGGMFLWVTLPEGFSAIKLFEVAMKEGVVFVPGEAFYTHPTPSRTMRLSFVSVSPEKIREGIARLGRSIQKLMHR